MERIIDLKKVVELVSLSKSQIYRLEKAGRFPKRFKLGKLRVGWRLSEIMAYIDCVASGSDYKYTARENNTSGDISRVW